MAKARRKFTPAPAEPTPPPVEPAAGKIIDAGQITMAGKSGLKVDARQFRPMDISDWGRPSPKAIYRTEAQRRLEAGEVPPEKTHKEFANDLCEWFIATYPDNKKPPAALTIERNTRNLWHRYH
jgi:hypothetical protein